MTATLTKSARYRTPTLSGSLLGVNRKAEVIYGVAVMQIGDISGADVRKQFVDETTLSQFVMMASSPKGIKGRFTHPDMSNDGLGTFVGRWKNPRVDGDVARADLHLSPRSHDSPKLGDVGKYILDLAESDPDMFGASMATLLDEAAMEKSRRADGFEPIRLRQLFAVDVVDNPALTHNGLFSVSDEFELPEQVSRILDSYFAGVQQADLRDRAIGYLDRYLTNRYGVDAMSKDTSTAPAITQESVDASIDKAVGAALEKFGAQVNERISAALADLKPQDPKPTEGELERKRCSELFATAKNAGLADYDKVAQDAIDKGLSVESFKASIADRLISQNSLSKDSGEPEADPDAKYKAEYRKNVAAFSAMQLSEAEYITSRRIDDGREVLAAAVA